jgi:hypothetical protein
MAKLGGFSLAVGETVMFAMDFSSVAAGGAITLKSAKAFDPSGGDVTSTIIASSPAPHVVDTTVILYVNGGSIQQTYYLSVTVSVLATSEVREGSVELTVAQY